MATKCKHQAGWYTDQALIWGDADGVYLEGRNEYRKRRRGKLVMTCNMPRCGATRNVYFKLPLKARLGKVRRAVAEATK